MKTQQQTWKNASGQLVPSPLQITDFDSIFEFNSEIGIISDHRFMDEALQAATGLAQALTWENPLSTTICTAAIASTDIDSNCSHSLVLKYCSFDAGKDEAYRITVSPEMIVIEAEKPAGIWWGLETIRQLVLSSGSRIPCFTCYDEPRFAWRGFMLDCSRHFFTVDFIKKMIDVASLHHLNRFHWHLVDDQGWRIPIPEYPLLTEVGAYRTKLKQTWDTTYGDYYSWEQIRDIIEFATKRHVMVVPEIETPGHASALLTAYPELGCTGGPYHVEARWGIFDDVMCAGNDKVLAVLDSVFKTVAELFPSPYIHIGGDECPRTRWKSCPKCQKRMQEEHLHSEDELQSWMTVQVSKLVEKYGKRPIGWDEVLEGTETLGLPKDVIVMSWRGLEGGIQASALGHEVIMCPSTAGCYLDHKHLDSLEEPGNLGVATVRDSYVFDPIVDGMDERQAKMVIGGQGNLWAEKVCFSKHAEYMYFPRLSALAEGLWTAKERKDFESFKLRLPALYARLEALGFYYYKGAVDEEAAQKHESRF